MWHKKKSIYLASLYTNNTVQIPGRIVEKTNWNRFCTRCNPCPLCFRINMKNMSLARKNWLLPAQNYTRRVLKTTLKFCIRDGWKFRSAHTWKKYQRTKKIRFVYKKNTQNISWLNTWSHSIQIRRLFQLKIVSIAQIFFPHTSLTPKIWVLY